MSRIVAVLNDSSGKGDCAEAAKRLAEIFEAAGREAQVVVAHGGSELSAAMKQAVEDGCEILVAGGGDGTINTAAQAIIGRDVRLGVLPLGTLNHFAKDLGIPLELKDAAEIVLNGIHCQVDVGEVNGRIFLNNSSLGVYPAIVRLRERYQAGGLGKWIAALWASLTVLRRNPFVAVRIVAEGDAAVRRTPFVFIGNNEYRMAGLHAGSRDTLSAGHLAVYVLNADRRVGLLRLGLEVLLRGAEQVKELDLLTVAEAAIETRRPRLQVALDGEVVVLESPLQYRVKPSALQVMVSESSTACHPLTPRASSSRPL